MELKRGLASVLRLTVLLLIVPYGIETPVQPAGGWPALPAFNRTLWN